MRWLTPSLLSLSLLAFSAPSGAQAQRPPAAPAPPSAPPSSPDASAPKPAPTPADDAALATPQIEVTDPLLELTLPPDQVLSTWQEALALVRSNSTDLRSALLRVEQARGQSRDALARALPQLSANANLVRHLLLGEGPNVFAGSLAPTTLPDPPTFWQAGLSLRIPVFAPQIWHDRGTAQRAVDVAKLNSREVQRLLLGAVADSIVDVITSERLLEVSQVSLRSALSTLELNRRREALGGGSQVEVLRAEQAAIQARAQVVSAAESVQRSREALGLALGTQAAWSVVPTIRIDALVADANAVCRRQPDVNQRTDVLVAQENVELARRRAQSVDYGIYPTVDLLSEATVYNSRFQTPNRERVTWTIAGVLSWNLYDGGSRYAQGDTAQAELGLAEEQVTSVRRQALLQVTQSARAVRVAEASLQIAERARDVAERNAELARVAFIYGAGTAFDLVDTEGVLRSAEIDRTIREFELVKARIAALLAQANCDI